MLAKHIVGYIPSLVIPGLMSFAGVYCYTRLLTPQEYGHYALAINTMMLLNAVFYNWLQISLPRLAPKAARDGTIERLKVTAYGAYLIESILLCLAGFAFIRLVPLGDFHAIAWLVPPLVILRAMLNINQAFHRSNLDFKRYNIIECGQSAIGFFLGFLLVWRFGMGAYGASIGIVCGLLLMTLIDIGRWFIASYDLFDPVILKSIARFGLPFVLASAFGSIISTSDRYLIDYFHGAGEVGIYAAGYALMDRASSILFMMISTPSYPLLMHRLEHEGHEAARDQTYRNGVAVLMLALPACVGMILTRHQLAAAFIGPAFREGALEVMPWIAVSGFLSGISAYYFDHAFHVGRKTHLFALTIGPAAFLNLALNLMLIPRYGYIAAAWTTLISYMLMLTLSIIIGRRVFPVHFPFKPALQITGAVAIMTVVLRMFTFSENALGLLQMVALGAAVYGAGICLFNVAGARDRLYQLVFVR